MDEGYSTQSEPFGAWLLTQAASTQWHALIAKAAKADHKFPKSGDAEAVRKHMGDRGADAEVYQMIDDAELDWSAL